MKSLILGVTKEAKFKAYVTVETKRNGSLPKLNDQWHCNISLT